ncbi:MAG: hypothetical protein LC660_11820 [Desulfobacteraceae bacterium]|nr:hypothetical protein [Desulfobacteraceae bacterium]
MLPPAILKKNNMSKTFTGLITPGIIGALTVIQVLLFLTGYRLTADDVLFHKVMMQGWEASWIFIKETAIGQGRIVHFVDLPFTLVGSYYADNMYFRTFYTGLYFSNFFLAGIYVERLLKVKITYLVILILLSFHPLDYFHLAPNAYPFRISLPLFLILISRIKLLDIRSRYGANYTAHFKIKEFLYLCLCFSGMSFSEYGFLVGFALILIEASISSNFVWKSNNALYKKIIKLIIKRDVRNDLCLILLFFIIYIGFGLIYPSYYSGNKISNDVQIFQIFKTLLGHIYGGTSFSSFFRYSKEIASFFFTLGKGQMILSLLVFSGTCFLANRVLTQIVNNTNLHFLRKASVPMIFYGLFFSFIVTIPVALTQKYQSWCVNIHACIFLDSRLSYFGFAVFASGVLLYVLPRSFLLFKKKTIIFSALLISIFSVLTYINNLRIEKDMRTYVAGWERAKIISDCAVEEDFLKFGYKNIIDPERKISFHPGFNVENYWALYIKERRGRNNSDCTDNRDFRDFLPVITHGERIDVRSSGKISQFLIKGWSHLEEWGVWSEGNYAQIHLPTKGRIEKINLELLPFVPNDSVQNLIIQSEGEVLKSVLLDTEISRTIVVSIPDEISIKAFQKGFIKIDFYLPDASSPLEQGINSDTRKIAIGLIALTIFHHGP